MPWFFLTCRYVRMHTRPPFTQSSYMIFELCIRKLIMSPSKCEQPDEIMLNQKYRILQHTARWIHNTDRSYKICASHLAWFRNEYSTSCCVVYTRTLLFAKELCLMPYALTPPRPEFIKMKMHIYAPCTFTTYIHGKNTGVCLTLAALVLSVYICVNALLYCRTSVYMCMCWYICALVTRNIVARDLA